MRSVNKKKGPDSWSHFLSMSLDRLRDRGLYRQLRLIDSPVAPSVTIDGRPFLLFCSNDYLGLANNSRMKAVAALAALVIVAVLLVMAVLPEQSANEPTVAVPAEIPEPDRELTQGPTMFETWPGEERLRPANGTVRVPNWLYRRNWRERMEMPETPDGGVRVIPTGGSSF